MVADRALWDLFAALWAMPDPGAAAWWMDGFRALGRRDLTPELVRARFERFVAGAAAAL